MASVRDYAGREAAVAVNLVLDGGPRPGGNLILTNEAGRKVVCRLDYTEVTALALGLANDARFIGNTVGGRNPKPDASLDDEVGELLRKATQR